jgi:hypothetical protein
MVGNLTLPDYGRVARHSGASPRGLTNSRRMHSEATSDSETEHSGDEGLWLLRRLSVLQFPIKPLQYKEGFLLLTMIGEKAFAIETILETRENSSRATEVLENPRRYSAKEGNAVQHGDLVLVKIFLVFLGPTSARFPMVAKERVTPEFAG